MPKNLLLTTSQGQKNMKFARLTAKILLIFVFLLAVFLFAQPILAANVNTGIEFVAQTGLGTTDIRITIARIIQAAFGFLGIVAVVLILYGGFIYMTSQGNPEKIEQAKKILRNAIIGLIIMLSAFAIASFILNLLISATGGSGFGGPPTYGGGGGALGNGIIESTYPARGAVDIPRNTGIIVTFKEAMTVASLVNDSGTPDTLDDVVNINNVKIHKSSEPNGPYVNARASFTPDLKTFVFKPVDLLGSPTEATDYKVELTSNIKKFDGNDAFGAYGGYDWTFSVSTITDLTAPKVVSVIPRFANSADQKVPRNMVVQINFSEPINPITMSGLVELQGGGTIGSLRRANDVVNTFNNILVCSTDSPSPNACNDTSDSVLAGQFMYSNQYRTVEFVTNDLCGKSTCGGNVYCLPGNKSLSVLVKTATLEIQGKPTSIFPYDGIVDMADNSLDGNSNGKAEGPGRKRSPDWPPYNLNDPNQSYGDELVWSFYTNNTIDLAPPEITTYYPTPGQTEVVPLDSFEVTFNKIMMASTLKPDSGYGDGYCPCSSNAQCGSLTCDTARQYCKTASNERFVCTPTNACPGTQACIEEEHLTLVQPSEAELQAANYPQGGWGYWLSSVNDSITNKTRAIFNHEILGENLNFGIHVGSGVKDIMQNCYQPCAGPSCVKEAKPGVTPTEYQPKAGQWQGTFPSCSL